MSSTSATPTTSSPSPTHSETQYPTKSGVTIPTTTVVGIGGGFVAFAIIVLSSLLFIRFIRLALSARRNGTPFRQVWDDQGGFFGWLHGIGRQDREVSRIRRMEELERAGYWAGGGGWYSSEITRMRMWNELRREGMKAEKDVGDRPGMWEVDFGGAGLSKGEDLDMTGQEKPLEMYEPLSIGPTNIPSLNTTKPSDPIMRLSLLIALPTRDAQGVSGDEDPDLPDMVIGTTLFVPTRSAAHRDLKDGAEIAHLDYGDDVVNASGGWVKKGDKWVIEGLDDGFFSLESSNRT